MAAGNCTGAVDRLTTEAANRSQQARRPGAVVDRQNVTPAASGRVAVTVSDRVVTVDVAATSRRRDARARRVQSASGDELRETSALSTSGIAVAARHGRLTVGVPSTSRRVLEQLSTPTAAPPSVRRDVISGVDHDVTGNTVARGVVATLAVGDL